ncbi:MAG: hypothetical protein N3G21_10215 [Candidatus Hydrogenedentes bacterium]|nr:hypothetical protein [Candidatus Hydrogenedentota bacterium]
MYRVRFYKFVLLLSFSGFVYGEEVASFSRVISQGSAEVVATPSHVEFVFVKIGEGITAEEALNALQDFDTKLRLRFTEESPRPVEINSSGPFILFKDKFTAEFRVSILFSLSGIISVTDSQKLFAKLWDKMRQVASEYSLVLKGPYLKVQNKETVEKSTVSMAIEKAYPLAEGSATALRGTIYAVDKIEIKELKWLHSGENSDEPVSLTEVKCRAEVLVTYLISE